MTPGPPQECPGKAPRSPQAARCRSGGAPVATPCQAEQIVRQVRGQPAILDLETRGLDPWHPDGYICGAAVKVYGGQARYLSFRHPDSANLPIRVLADVVAAASRVDNHNRRFDVKQMFVRHGIPLPPGRDSMTAMTLDHENHLGPTGTRKGAYQLKYRCGQHFGPEAIQAETELVRMMLDRGLDPKADLWQATAQEVAAYACADVDLVDRAFTEWLDPRMEKLGIEDLAAEMYAYDELLTQIEVDGMHLDRGFCERELARAEKEEAILRRRIGRHVNAKAHTEVEVNPGSPVQMRSWLGLPTTESWRLRASKDPDAKLLLTWRQYAKAVGTYWQPYLDRSNAAGLLHPSFWYTRTGRLTCFEPNLHATPHEEKSPAYTMKQAWVAPPGYFLLYADWSQAEMRLCAHYTQDDDLMRWFAEKKDIHQMVADSLGCDRQTAKPLNYGSAYGMGKAKLAREYGMTEADAAKWLAKYHATIQGPRSLYKRMGQLAETKWWIRFWDGRYRRFSLSEAVRAFPHSASNSLLQGGVGAMARKKMLELKDWCYGQGGCMWLQIHDAVIFCLPEALDQPGTFRHVKTVMEDFPFRVHMTVDLGKGRTWSEAARQKLVVA